MWLRLVTVGLCVRERVSFADSGPASASPLPRAGSAGATAAGEGTIEERVDNWLTLSSSLRGKAKRRFFLSFLDPRFLSVSPFIRKE